MSRDPATAELRPPANAPAQAAVSAGADGEGVPSAAPLAALAWGALLAPLGAGLAVKAVGSGRYAYANDTLLGWLGRAAGEVLGRTDGDLFDAELAAALRAGDKAALAHEGAMAAEHRLALQGRPHDLTVWRLAWHEFAPRAAAGARPAPPEPQWLLSLWFDPAERRRHEAQLRQALAQIEQLQGANEALRRELADQTLRDRASGLYAKAHFEDQLRREVDLSSREHREFSLVLVEIDAASGGVSAVVPEASAASDLSASADASESSRSAVLSALGRLLRGGTRAMDAACRLDERRFAVLLSGVGLATAHSRMEGLRRRCATEIVVSRGRELRFSVSMGVASFPHTAHNEAELLQACAAALHEAQRRGGNHVALAAIRFEVPS